MSVQLNRMSLDLGIVSADGAAALAFYCDTLGLALATEISVPGGAVKKIKCGDSFIKIFVPDQPPTHLVQRGGLAAATGYRYCTLSIRNVDAVVQKCREAGYRIAVDVRELRPGVKVALIEDPDGNTVELMQEA